MFSPLARHSFSKLQAREARREALDQRMSDEQILKAREVVVLCLHPTIAFEREGGCSGLFTVSQCFMSTGGPFFFLRSLSNTLLLHVVASVLKKRCHLFGFSEKTRDTRCNLHHPSLSTIASLYPEMSGDVSRRGSFVESIRVSPLFEGNFAW